MLDDWVDIDYLGMTAASHKVISKPIINNVNDSSFITKKANKSVATKKKFAHDSPVKPSDTYYSLKIKFMNDIKNRDRGESQGGQHTIFQTSTAKQTSRQSTSRGKGIVANNNYMKPLAKQLIVNSKQEDTSDVQPRPSFVNQECLGKAAMLYLREIRKLQDKETKRKQLIEHRNTKEMDSCTFKPETLSKNLYYDNAK